MVASRDLEAQDEKNVKNMKKRVDNMKSICYSIIAVAKTRNNDREKRKKAKKT